MERPVFSMYYIEVSEAYSHRLELPYTIRSAATVNLAKFRYVRSKNYGTRIQQNIQRLANGFCAKHGWKYESRNRNVPLFDHTRCFSILLCFVLHQFSDHVYA